MNTSFNASDNPLVQTEALVDNINSSLKIAADNLNSKNLVVKIHKTTGEIETKSYANPLAKRIYVLRIRLAQLLQGKNYADVVEVGYGRKAKKMLMLNLSDKFKDLSKNIVDINKNNEFPKNIYEFERFLDDVNKEIEPFIDIVTKIFKPLSEKSGSDLEVYNQQSEAFLKWSSYYTSSKQTISTYTRLCDDVKGLKNYPILTNREVDLARIQVTIGKINEYQIKLSNIQSALNNSGKDKLNPNLIEDLSNEIQEESLAFIENLCSQVNSDLTTLETLQDYETLGKSIDEVKKKIQALNLNQANQDIPFLKGITQGLITVVKDHITALNEKFSYEISKLEKEVVKIENKIKDKSNNTAKLNDDKNTQDNQKFNTAIKALANLDIHANAEHDTIKEIMAYIKSLKSHEFKQNMDQQLSTSIMEKATDEISRIKNDPHYQSGLKTLQNFQNISNDISIDDFNYENEIKNKKKSIILKLMTSIGRVTTELNGESNKEAKKEVERLNVLLDECRKEKADITDKQILDAQYIVDTLIGKIPENKQIIINRIVSTITGNEIPEDKNANEVLKTFIETKQNEIVKLEKEFKQQTEHLENTTENKKEASEYLLEYQKDTTQLIKELKGNKIIESIKNQKSKGFFNNIFGSNKKDETGELPSIEQITKYQTEHKDIDQKEFDIIKKKLEIVQFKNLQSTMEGLKIATAYISSLFSLEAVELALKDDNSEIEKLKSQVEEKNAEIEKNRSHLTQALGTLP